MLQCLAVITVLAVFFESQKEVELERIDDVRLSFCFYTKIIEKKSSSYCVLVVHLFILDLFINTTLTVTLNRSSQGSSNNDSEV